MFRYATSCTFCSHFFPVRAVSFICRMKLWASASRVVLRPATCISLASVIIFFRLPTMSRMSSSSALVHSFSRRPSSVRSSRSILSWISGSYARAASRPWLAPSLAMLAYSPRSRAIRSLENTLLSSRKTFTALSAAPRSPSGTCRVSVGLTVLVLRKLTSLLISERSPALSFTICARSLLAFIFASCSCMKLLRKAIIFSRISLVRFCICMAWSSSK